MDESGEGESGEGGSGYAAAFPQPAGLCRAIRRRADASQREIAQRTGLSRSTIARIETGRLVPSLAVLSRLLVEAGLCLVAVDAEGRVVHPMADPVDDDLRDGADRRYPSHLDTIVDPRSDDWWASIYGMAGPPETATGTASGGTSSAGEASGRSASPASGTSRPRRRSRPGCGDRGGGREGTGEVIRPRGSDARAAGSFGVREHRVPP